VPKAGLRVSKYMGENVPLHQYIYLYLYLYMYIRIYM